MTETVDICDENNNTIGVNKLSEAHKKGLWHRAAHVWIYDSNGRILLQLRAKNKLTYPNRWDASAAGHVDSGEQPIETALREMEEEIGLKAKESELDFYKIRKSKKVFGEVIENEFQYIYFLRYDGNIKKLKLQGDEVQKIEFLSEKELKEGLRNNPESYVPHGDYWFEIIKEIKNKIDSK